MIEAFSSEWEWGWKSPLLLFPSPVFSDDLSHLPPSVLRFLSAPLSDFHLDEAEAVLKNSLTHLKTSRIGIRFERIQEALFRAHPDTESLRTGIQIPGVTEIDLLHKLHSLPRTTIHWEIAVKFYLAVDAEGSTDPDRWIGPSQQDALGVKMRAIRDRQLRALTDPKVRESLGIPLTDTILALPKVHGVLFTPWNLGRSLVRPSIHPPGVTPGGARGAWLYETHSDEFLTSIRSEHPDARILIMKDRQEWIRDHTQPKWSGPSPGFLEVPPSDRSLKNYFNDRSKTLSGGDTPGKEPIQGTLLTGGKEIRFFVVPESWGSTLDGALESIKAKSRI